MAIDIEKARMDNWSEQINVAKKAFTEAIKKHIEVVGKKTENMIREKMGGEGSG